MKELKHLVDYLNIVINVYFNIILLTLNISLPGHYFADFKSVFLTSVSCLEQNKSSKKSMINKYHRGWIVAIKCAFAHYFVRIMRMESHYFTFKIMHNG